jgi:hypothetical protein
MRGLVKQSLAVAGPQSPGKGKRQPRRLVLGRRLVEPDYVQNQSRATGVVETGSPGSTDIPSALSRARLALFQDLD